MSMISRSFGAWKAGLALTALCLMIVGSGGLVTRVGAQDATATAGSPIVGVWVVNVGGETSITSFGADGALVDIESTGGTGVGAWSATGPTSGSATFIMFFADENQAAAGSAVLRITMDYDEASDSLTLGYSVTGMMPDGSVISEYTDQGTGTATRLPIEGVEMVGTPFAGFVAGPVATPAN